MSRVADLMILNILCIICCLPIVTAGASITAMYYVTLKMARGEESYIVKGFFHSFRENLKQATIIHVIMLLLGMLLTFDLYFTRNFQAVGTFYTILTYVFIAGIVVYLMVLTYIYPILAKFYNSVKLTFRNALLMSIRHLPYTILMLVVTIAPAVVIFAVPVAFSILFLFYSLMGFAVISLFNSYFLRKIFDNYIPTEDSEKDKDANGGNDEIDDSVFTNLHPVKEEPDDEDKLSE